MPTRFELVNGAFRVLPALEVPTGFEPVNGGFAGPGTGTQSRELESMFSGLPVMARHLLSPADIARLAQNREIDREARRRIILSVGPLSPPTRRPWRARRPGVRFAYAQPRRNPERSIEAL